MIFLPEYRIFNNLWLGQIGNLPYKKTNSGQTLITASFRALETRQEGRVIHKIQ